MLPGVVLSGYVRLHIWLHTKCSALALSRAILPVPEWVGHPVRVETGARYGRVQLLTSVVVGPGGFLSSLIDAAISASLEDNQAGPEG